MKSITKYLTFHTKKRFKLINITPEIEKIVQESNVNEGICLVNSMHITSSIFINDDEGGLHLDFER
ncbi:MAG TPA: YjbQ family protein, partial [Nitrososphaeraceae archaeon]|nr:YjbQ family protein [Nitrososphaeraceae archaeon]